MAGLLDYRTCLRWAFPLDVERLLKALGREGLLRLRTATFIREKCMRPSIVAQELYIKRGTVGLTIGSDHTFLKLRHRATNFITLSPIH